jgi:hypothetical protein
MGVLFSWPVIVAVLIAIAIKTGYSRKLYYAALGTDLRAVTKDEYELFMHCYTGQLTYEAIGKHIEQYTDLLGKVRATISLNEGDSTYYVSSHWWRRHADRDFR